MNHIRKHKLIIYWLSAITLISCSGNKENKSESTGQIEKEIAKVIPEIQLETFGYLEEVMGCSCYLASDSLQFRQQNFIYAEKYGLPDKSGFGFIKIDQQLVRLEVLSIEENKEKSLRNVRLGNEQIEVWLSLELNKSEEPEVLPVLGEIEIIVSDHLPLKQKVYGTCGC